MSPYSLHLYLSFKITAPTQIYTLSLHDALPISRPSATEETARPDDSVYIVARLVSTAVDPNEMDGGADQPDRKSTRLNSSHVAISYAVFCLKKKKKKKKKNKTK